MNEKTFLIASPLPGRQPIARFSVASRPKLSPPEAVNQEEIPEEDRQFHLPASARDEPAGNAHARSRGPAAAIRPGGPGSRPRITGRPDWPGIARAERNAMSHPYITQRQVQRADELVSWTHAGRLRFLWYRLRLTVSEMNHATRRLLELQTRLP